MALEKIAREVGFNDTQLFGRVINWIKSGAEIGCKGKFRSASVSGNTKGAYDNGPQVTDAIAAWVDAGFAYGPVEEEDVPADAKINSILTRPKPNGTVRIILNLSAPVGISVNDGIDIAEFPATMSSTQAWVAVLNRAGRGCWITKTDWANAYKHIAVVEQDTKLQWFEWGGKYFKELCLIFGASSSAGIFDATAKVVLELVCRVAGFSRSMICQHLDDACAASARREQVAALDKAFIEVAAACGIQLAPRDDPEKSFSPCQQGVVFGISYNTLTWTWEIPPEKKYRLIDCIQRTILAQTVTATEAKSLAGKLIHIKPLIPAGKYNINFVMALDAEANRASSKNALIPVPDLCKRQLQFWLLMLKACDGFVSIPRFPVARQPWAMDAFCDAAGGSLDGPGKGTGGVCGSWWFYIPWSKRVCAGGWSVDGVKVGRKLSALELIGPLVFLVAGRDIFTGKHVNIWVDNSGSVAIWDKGYSNSCRLSTAIVTAISAVAAAIGCTVHLVKVSRCSSTGTELADALSKADFKRFRNVAQDACWGLDCAPAAIPSQLLAWIDKPTPDMDLAEKILKQLAVRQPTLGYHA